MNSCNQRIDYPGVSSKCFLVTGASSGIGRETALLLDALGATVILNGRDEKRLEATRSLMKGKTHHVAPADLRDIDPYPWMKDLVEATNVSLSGVAHCAGTHTFTPLRTLTEEAMNSVLHDCTTITARLFHAACRLKTRAPECSLVTMTSVSSHFGIVGNALYGASRAAVESLCRSFAIEFSRFGIRCNAISGGYMEGSGMTESGEAVLGQHIMTEMAAAYPLGFGHVRDSANAMVFLLGSASRWITGITLTVDGGYTAKGV